MNVIKRKNTPPTQFGREGKFRFMLQIKLALVLLCAGLGYFVYSNWQSWLESLDGDRKITAYALVWSKMNLPLIRMCKTYYSKWVHL